MERVTSSRPTGVVNVKAENTNLLWEETITLRLVQYFQIMLRTFTYTRRTDNDGLRQLRDSRLAW